MNIQQIKHTVITCTMTQIDRANRHSIREVKETVSHTTHKDLKVTDVKRRIDQEVDKYPNYAITIAQTDK